MIKLRIPIREQLACLVFLAVSLSLTVITLATWYTNHGFVLDVRSVKYNCLLAGQQYTDFDMQV